MKKYVCTVCGYIAEGTIPEQCPVCKAPASAFVEKTGNTYVTEHVVGIGKAEGVPQEIVEGLRANFEGECSEVGMYLAMARVAEREGYPEIAEAYKRYAYEEADHASRFAELLGEVVTDSTKKNLMMRAEAECGACSGKMDLAKKAKALHLAARMRPVMAAASRACGSATSTRKSEQGYSSHCNTPPRRAVCSCCRGGFFVVKYLQKSSQSLQLFCGICIFQLFLPCRIYRPHRLRMPADDHAAALALGQRTQGAEITASEQNGTSQPLRAVLGTIAQPEDGPCSFVQR